jgi:WD40 repeat protein
VINVAITSDNKYIVSGGDKTVRVWSLNSKEQQVTLPSSADLVEAVPVASNK